jgi:8-oxo-dGTP pyrophosphatase MutT (NUDIX family)
VKKAAGILFVSLNHHGLFLKRGPHSDYPGYWCFPGGGQEGDETPEQTAIREAREEIGFVPEGERHLLCRQKMGAANQEGAVGFAAPNPIEGEPALTVSEPVDFTTYRQAVSNEFVPELNDEHVGWAWAPIKSPPEPLHPGCRIALERIGMDELDVARAMSEGKLISPQRYENMSLFAIRITGTKVAYRKARDEFCYRNPANYLSERFVARCNGLPVIFVQRSGKEGGFHPSGALLNSEEFAERVVGSIFLPYIAGDEVWGIAKIYDDDAARRMEEEDLSTSPAVFFRDADANAAWKMEDGSTLLIEGNPSLLDHVAVCEKGVWDKGREPTGVRSETLGDSIIMAATPAKTPTEEEKAAAIAAAGTKTDTGATGVRADAEGEEEKKEEEKEKKEEEGESKADAETWSKKIDAIADMLNSLHSRMDALEGEGPSGDQPAENKGEGEQGGEGEGGDEDQQAQADAFADAIVNAATERARADAEKALSDTAKKIADLEKRLPKALDDADFHAVRDAQALADDVFSNFGQMAPRPLDGENVKMYQQRCVRMLQPHSQTWAKVDFNKSNLFADDAGFIAVRDQVYNEAKAAAARPTNIPTGTLREVKRQRDGHIIKEFHGQPRDWMDTLAGPFSQKLTGKFDDSSIKRH